MIKNKNIFFVFFLVIFIAVFSSCTRNNFKYHQSVEKSFQDMKNIKLFPLNKLVEVLVNADTSNYQFIDIRNPHQFADGHILYAISIPFKNFYGKNFDIFCKNHKIFLIYGKSTSQAKLAYFYLKSLGIKNIYAVGGGYEYLDNYIIRHFSIHSANYDDEKAKYDYAKVIAQTAGTSSIPESSTTAVLPPVVHKKKSAGNIGGCE